MIDIIHRIGIKTPVMQVYKALTTLEGLGNWWTEEVKGDTKVGGKIDNVHVPEHFDKSGDEIMENPVSVEMYQQIQEYKRYMDSLGEPIRPSLLDSIKILEEIYLQQQK